MRNVLFIALFGVGNANDKNAPAMKMLACDGCQVVMGPLSADLDYLIQGEKYWDDDTLKQRIGISCQHPTIPSGAIADACSYFLQDYHAEVHKEIKKR